MKKGYLKKEGKYWKVSSSELRNPMTIAGDFGLLDEMDNQEIEFDNSKGPITIIRYKGRDYTRIPVARSENTQSRKWENQKSERRGSDHSISEKKELQLNDPARAPYNFVPLNRSVAISNGNNDFSKYEGLSGIIKLQIEVKSPLFIRGANNLFVANGVDPFIPGSSLRGMIRNIVNITSYGKLNQYSDRTLFHRSSLMNDGKNVYPGFLRYEKGVFFIDEANAVQSQDEYILSKQPYNYIYDVDKKSCKYSVGEFHNSCRVWVFTKKSGIVNISDSAIEGYEHDDTRSEKAIDLLKSIKKNLIVNGEDKPIGKVIVPFGIGIPVFYRIEKDKAISFGHAKYHRIPYSHSIKDHISQESKKGLDFSESIFGSQEHPSKVFFDDFYLKGNPKYDLDSPMTPKILSSPKPTTYQHYLEQPDLYTPQLKQNNWSKPDVQVRGYKNYWHKETSSNIDDKNTWIETTDECASNPEPINPISSRSIFEGFIRYENLTVEELGALIFSIDLPPNCCHKIGMGKPLGLGSIRISIIQISNINRGKRYINLFEDSQWNHGVDNQTDNILYYKNAFAKSICEQIQEAHYVENKGFMSLWENDRMLKLMEMLKYTHNIDNYIVKWNNRTRYMENGAGGKGINEFKHRPILPTPDIVVQKNTYKKPQPCSSTYPTIPLKNGMTHKSKLRSPNMVLSKILLFQKLTLMTQQRRLKNSHAVMLPNVRINSELLMGNLMLSTSAVNHALFFSL